MYQMTAKAAIKKHRKKVAEAALMREFAQLEGLDVYKSASIIKRQRKAALRALNLIKEKRDGDDLKGRTAVVDGCPQRSLYDKSEMASPTVSTDALTLSIMIDKQKRRDMGTADVAGA
jgi:hypothetical protein